MEKLLRYYQEIKGEKSTYSVDKIKLVGSCSLELGEKLAKMLNSKCTKYSMRLGQFQYKHNFNYSFVGGNAYVGVFLIPMGKAESCKNTIEFNPNKVRGDRQFEELLDCFYSYNKDIRVSSWDFAVDCPVSRDRYSLVKDNRNYQLNISRSKTEYLGTRHTDGFVKLYDKAYESQLEMPMTRLEISFDGIKGWDDVKHHVPIVRCLGEVNTEELSGMDKWIVDRIMESDDKERLIRELSRAKKQKIVPLLSANSEVLKVEQDCYSNIISQLREYENRLFEPFTGWVYMNEKESTVFDE